MSDASPHRSATWLAWAARLTAAAILGQTLFFKFSGAEESRAIFTRLGVEPWGRIAAGVAELAAVVLLLIPALGCVGAALALGIMGGAILSHLTVLGIEVQGDGGLLFYLAWIVVGCSALVLWLQRADCRALLQRLLHRGKPHVGGSPARAERIARTSSSGKGGAPPA